MPVNAGIRPLSCEKGFTLLELILVMVIISTILAIAAPSLRGFFSSRKTHDTASNILSLIRFARSQAITEGHTYRLNFDSDKGVYWLTSDAAGAFSKLNTDFGLEFPLPDDTTVEIVKDDDDDKNNKEDEQDSETYIAFFPQGMAEIGTITLTDRSGEKIEITSPSPAENYRIIESEETET
jgi:type II secretion system protein H